MGPVIVSHCIYVFKLLVLGEIKCLVDVESILIFVFQAVYSLRVVHDIKALRAVIIFYVVCNRLWVTFKCHEAGTS